MGTTIVVSVLMQTYDALAQDVASRIDALNAVTGKDYTTGHRGRTLIVDGFREGQQVKEDRVNIYDLDVATLKYDTLDNAVSVKCFSDVNGCVARILMLDKKKSYRDRLVFAVPANGSGVQIEERLRLLINTMTAAY